MIANLITTLMLALGVASGSYQSETCNAFKHVEERQEKPIQKATINNNYNLVFGTTATYDDANTKYWSYKYVLWETAENNGVNPTENGGVNVILDPFLITNTAYTFSSIISNQRYTWSYTFLKFTNYTNSVQNLRIEADMTFNGTANSNLRRIVYESTDNTLDGTIDLTLNASTRDTVENKLNNAEKTSLYDNQYWYVNQTSQSVNTTTPQITLEGGTWKYVIIVTRNLMQSADNYGWMTLDNLIITGTYIQNNVTQEIINVPELMFTIITLPFAWYSTAFNLTIFPNTPYQLNFGNLILTIVGALVLLYLIKKVLK